jgi:hypothetical protein
MCKNSTLKGKYGFYRTGTNTVAGTPPTVNNVAAAGFIVFDGKGGTTSYQNTSMSGVISEPNSQGVGFYHVYKNCLFTLSVAPYVAASDVDIDLTKVIAVGVIVDDGKELNALSTAPGRAVVLIAKKM